MRFSEWRIACVECDSVCGSRRRSAPSAPVPVRTCTVLAAPELLALALLLPPTLLSLLSSAMGKHAQLVIGPAGSGKSTFCHLIQEHCDATKRTVHIVNLDPAAEHFSYRPTLDIRDLVSVDDVMEELDLGPNGALVYAMEYLLENSEWLEEELDGYGPDDYLLFDCPGQIELYTHLPVFRQLVNGVLRKFNYSVCCVNVIDSQFIADASKFLSASLVSLSAMMSLELPHINVLSKVDILKRCAWPLSRL